MCSSGSQAPGRSAEKRHHQRANNREQAKPNSNLPLAKKPEQPVKPKEAQKKKQKMCLDLRSSNKLRRLSLAKPSSLPREAPPKRKRNLVLKANKDSMRSSNDDATTSMDQEQ